MIISFYAKDKQAFEQLIRNFEMHVAMLSWQHSQFQTSLIEE